MKAKVLNTCRLLVLLFACWSLALLAGVEGEELRDRKQWWVANYVDYSQTERGVKDPRAAAARRVFDRLATVADGTAAISPQMVIVDVAGDPYAVALPDGGIVLARSVLDFCYPNGVTPEGDARVAFVLGHELAHLSNRDYSHRQAFQEVRKYGRDKADENLAQIWGLAGSGPGGEVSRADKQKEVMADRAGILYALMAGYPVGGMFDGQSGFFAIWTAQPGLGKYYDDGPGHPSPQKRQEFVRSKLQALREKAEIFNAGVLLFAKGAYRDAAAAFAEFAREYPAREVFNNVGACWYNMALARLQKLETDLFLRFRLSVSLDAETGAAPSLRSRGGGGYPKEETYAKYVEEATRYFKMAVDRDPAHAPTRVNLSAALILGGECSQAQEEAGRALKQDPKNPDAMVDMAVAIFNYGEKMDIDMYEKAAQYLKDALAVAPNHLDALYNLASLREERGRSAETAGLWERYAASASEDAYRERARSKAHGQPVEKKAVFEPPPFAPGDVRVGDSAQDVERKWAVKGKVSAFSVGLGAAQVVDLKVLARGDLRAVLLGGKVEVLQAPPAQSVKVEEADRRWGSPARILKHMGGAIRVYQGFCLLDNQGEARWVAWFK